LRRAQRHSRAGPIYTLLDREQPRKNERARSLVAIYLAPLDGLRDSGHELRQTLRAYFAAGHNVEATAAALEVDRSTVRLRVRKIEQALGCPLATRQAEMEVAVRLEELYETPPLPIIHARRSRRA
jgi:DNA-binding PucR family transcriptional regulator